MRNARAGFRFYFSGKGGGAFLHHGMDQCIAESDEFCGIPRHIRYHGLC